MCEYEETDYIYEKIYDLERRLSNIEPIINNMFIKVQGFCPDYEKRAKDISIGDYLIEPDSYIVFEIKKIEKSKIISFIGDSLIVSYSPRNHVMVYKKI